MAKLFALLLFSAYIAGSFQSPAQFKNTDELIAYINNLNTTWKAGRNFDDSYTEEHFRGLMGVLPTRPKIAVPRNSEFKVNARDLPENFDTRQKFGTECPNMAKVHDQGACASDWAISTAAAIGDRICVATKGKTQVEISAEHLLSCCKNCVDPDKQGCEGGHPESVWYEYQNYGIPSGGDYGSKVGCKSYSIEPCEHHVTGKLKPCSQTVTTAPKCESTCQSGFPHGVDQDRHFGTKWLSVMAPYKSDGEILVMQELYDNGPLVTQFEVFEDFLSYKSGIYEYKTGKSLGLHSVKVVGWGIEGGIPYWTAINSFNEEWGDKGQFRVRRDVDECGFNTGFSFGIVDLSKEPHGK